MSTADTLASPAHTDRRAHPAPVSVGVLAIGAGQAGLSAAYHLQRVGLDYLVLDAEDGPGGAWQHRWPTLTMSTVNGIRELPDMPVPDIAAAVPARQAIPEYFAGYEHRFDLRILRPVQVIRVRSDPEDPVALLAETASGERFRAQALINATGTWSQPFWPIYPGALSFRGQQFHTHDYPGPAAFAGRRAVVVGGGISAVQLLLEIAPVAAAHTWVTRREPVWNDREFSVEYGHEVVAKVAERVSLGLPPASVVSVTGLPLTAEIRQARRSGVLDRKPMFARIVPEGVRWADGQLVEADILLWCTGFRAALGHLADLRLREPGGGITMIGTRTARDARVHLVGYGPSASTIGANRAGRSAVSEIQRMLTNRASGP